MVIYFDILKSIHFIQSMMAQSNSPIIYGSPFLFTLIAQSYSNKLLQILKLRGILIVRNVLLYM